MRTLLGPYQQDTPEAKKLEAMDKSWVSAVELAGVAIQLAQLKGLKEPDVAGAVLLLKQTWRARHALTPLACADMELVHDIYGREVEAASVIRKPDKDFPGSAIIRPPRSYPIPLDEAVRHVSGEYSRKRRTDFRLRMLNSSRAALGKELRTVYAATKAGLLGMTRTWALELAPYGVTVNAIGPGPIATELFLSGNPPDSPKTKKILESIPLKRMGEPDDIAHAVASLLDDRAGFITGQVLYVCGGLTVGLGQVA